MTHDEKPQRTVTWQWLRQKTNSPLRPQVQRTQAMSTLIPWNQAFNPMALSHQHENRLTELWRVAQCPMMINGSHTPRVTCCAPLKNCCRLCCSEKLPHGVPTQRWLTSHWQGPSSSHHAAGCWLALVAHFARPMELGNSMTDNKSWPMAFAACKSFVFVWPIPMVSWDKEHERFEWRLSATEMNKALGMGWATEKQLQWDGFKNVLHAAMVRHFESKPCHWEGVLLTNLVMNPQTWLCDRDDTWLQLSMQCNISHCESWKGLSHCVVFRWWGAVSASVAVGNQHLQKSANEHEPANNFLWERWRVTATQHAVHFWQFLNVANGNVLPVAFSVVSLLSAGDSLFQWKSMLSFGDNILWKSWHEPPANTVLHQESCAFSVHEPESTGQVLTATQHAMHSWKWETLFFSGSQCCLLETAFGENLGTNHLQTLWQKWHNWKCFADCGHFDLKYDAVHTACLDPSTGDI